MVIIPAIDVMEGKCVRLTEGDYSKKTVYDAKPLEVALQFEDVGIKRLHVVDLDGAKQGAVRNWKVLEDIAAKTGLMIDFGGGIKSQEDVRIAFNSGAALVNVGSIAVKNETEFRNWLRIFGAQRFMLGADVRNEMIVIAGWREETQWRLTDFLEKNLAIGVQEVFCTDVSLDGKLQGPATPLYERILQRFPNLFLIASGGIRSLADVDELRVVGCKGAIIGKAFYEGRISIKELKAYT